MSKQDLTGDRIKAYEAQENGRRALPGLPLVIRIDGRSFSKFTHGMVRPFDGNFTDLMVDVTKYLVGQLNAVVGYTQSDEITLVLDPATLAKSKDRLKKNGEILPDHIFDGRYQKIASVAAGLATARFVKDALSFWPERCQTQLPVFDARVFQVPDLDEAAWAVAWRELDAIKNAVSMAARAQFPHKELHGKSTKQMIAMMAEEGVIFADYPVKFRRGTYVRKRTVFKELSAATLAKIPKRLRPEGPVARTEIVAFNLPFFMDIGNYKDVILNGAEPVENIFPLWSGTEHG